MAPSMKWGAGPNSYGPSSPRLLRGLASGPDGPAHAGGSPLAASEIAHLRLRDGGLVVGERVRQMGDRRVVVRDCDQMRERSVKRGFLAGKKAAHRGERPVGNPAPLGERDGLLKRHEFAKAEIGRPAWRYDCRADQGALKRVHCVDAPPVSDQLCARQRSTRGEIGKGGEEGEASLPQLFSLRLVATGDAIESLGYVGLAVFEDLV